MMTQIGLDAPSVRLLIDGRGIDMLSGARLVLETDMINVTSYIEAREPDPAWVFTDTAGHFHAWSKRELPTLRIVRAPRHECSGEDCAEVDDDDSYACLICGEAVEPAMRVMSPQPPSVIPGRRSWRIEHVRVVGVPEWLPGTVNVSVRLELGDLGQRFGVATVSNIGLSSWNDPDTVTSFDLLGDGPLGERLPAVATHVGNDVT